jgi:tight adherence protein C
MFWINAWLGLVIFLSVTVSAYLALRSWLPSAHDRRVQAVMDRPQPDGPSRLTRGRVWLQGLLLSLSHWARPANEKEQDFPATPSIARQRLVQAGLRGRHALPVFYGAKAALALCLPALSLVIWWFWAPAPADKVLAAALVLSATVGYYLPDIAVRWGMTRRQTILLRAFPDALDLLRVCVQAGLGLDAAIERVGRDMRITCPAIAEEFTLTGLTLRAGLQRSAALQQLSDRMGLPDVEGLVGMLIQADRFGSSMAQSLFLYSESLRTKRRLIAEEAAAQLPVKLLVPLIFCIFPSLLTVLLGPVVISFQQHFHPQAVGG